QAARRFAKGDRPDRKRPLGDYGAASCPSLPPSFASSGDRMPPGAAREVEPDRRHIAQDIEHGAVAVDGCLQPLNVFLACRAVDLHHGADIPKPWPNAVDDGEEAA